MLAQQLLNGIVIGGVYALFALGFTLVFGVQHIMNLAHGAVFMWGAFVGLYTVTHLDAPLPVAFVLAMLAGGMLSVAVDWVAFRPLRKRGASEFSAIISSIGASLILISVAQQVSETRVMRFPFGVFPLRIFEVAGLRITLLQLVIAMCVALMVAGLMYYLYRTSFGRQVRAVAVNERTASLLGINPAWVYFQTFFVAGALAGAAGVIIGIAFNSVHFLMGEPLMLRAFVVIILGGLGSIPGALIAGLLLGVMQSLTVAYISSELSDTIIFSLLFLILLVKPTGFFPGLRRDAKVART